MSILDIVELGLARGGEDVVRGLSFKLRPGKITVVLGPNGAGKSSLLLALAGMLPLASGSIELKGQTLEHYSRQEISSLIAWQGELPLAEFGLSVRQRLHLARADAGRAGEDRLCGMADIAHLLKRPLGRLSAGELQRVELAAVLLRNSPVMLLDEPTAHLDLRHQTAWLHSMRKQAASGKALCVVLHDIQQAACVADEVVFIYGGGKAAHGDAAGMLTRARLEVLFDAPILALEQEGLILPDYRSVHEDA
ncbi:MAG: ABC transporter ATP-binding protein [Mariprofundaceae bacterium]